MKNFISALLGAVLVAALAVAPASAAGEEKSDNLKHVHQFKYTGGTELATDGGRYLYSGELNGTDDRGQDQTKGGLHIFDTRKMKEVGFLHCPGTDNDVEFIKPGLVVMAFSQNTCAPTAGAGLMLVNVKNPKRPQIISALNTGKSHTLKPVPGTSLIYMAGGGLTGGTNAGPAIVDVKNPAKPKVVATYKTYTMDCHDIGFSFTEEDRKLGFCAGAIGTGEVKIWDMTDPLVPVLLGEIINPAIQYSHYAVANHDGTILAIDDEAFVAHDCNTGLSPTGRVWFYDITNPQLPIPAGSMAAPRGGNAGYANIGTIAGWTTSWCLAHGLDWHPKTNNLAVTWFTGGVSVIDANDPLAPVEAAYFKADDSTTYSTLWHDGLLYTNDMLRGVDAFKITGLK